MMKQFNYSVVEEKIHYVFKDKSLLLNAFVHSSYANEYDLADNERMEFLGDSILGDIVSRYLYKLYPEKDAGELSKARSIIVSAKGLKEPVRDMDILKHLLVASNSVKLISRSKKIEANLFEALLCAIFFDGGYDSAVEFVMRWLKGYMDNVDNYIARDYKTLLQEFCQRERMHLVYGEVERSGPDNNVTFIYRVEVDGVVTAIAEGKSIKQAQANCAKIALSKLNGGV